MQLGSAYAADHGSLEHFVRDVAPRVMDNERLSPHARPADIVDRVARDNPEKVLEVMARVLPKELAVTVEQKNPRELGA